MKIIFGIPVYGEAIKLPFAIGLLATQEILIAQNIKYDIVFCSRGAIISKNRSLLIENFMKSDGTDFMFLDYDIGFPPEKLWELINRPEELVAGVYPNKIQVDDDSNTSTDSLSAIYVGTDGDGTGAQYGLNVVGSGIDYAVYAQNGAVRIGTGATPGQTIGDDTLFVEGLAEIDGVLYADGGITGLGTASIAVGLARKHESYAGADNVITVAESGTVFDNTADGDGSMHTLPEASTAIGCYYTFVVTAAQALVVEVDDADVILHLSLNAGDKITSSTVGDSITLVALDATNWGVVSCYPTAADWADGGA